MRDFKNMKRQRGRNRGGGMGGNNGGGGKPQQNANRAFDSNGPDNVKIRGHAQHVFEKYQQLARDAFSSGDRVVAENYLQHADHYFRVLRTLQPQRSPSEILGRDSLASGLDIDFEEEFDQAEEAAEAAGDAAQEANGDAQPRQEPRRDERYDRNEGRRDGYEARDTRPDRYEPRRDGETPSREQGPYRDRQDNRDRGEGRDRADSRQDSRDRPDNRDRQQPARDRFEGRDRAEGGQDSRERSDRFEGRRDNRRFEGRRDDRPFNRDGRQEDRRPTEGAASDPLPVMAPEAFAPSLPATQPQGGQPSGLQPSGAQPFAVEAEASPVLRSQDGGMSEAPAFLQPAGDDEVRKPRPRRRRAPRSFEAGGEGDAQAPVAEAEEA